MATLRLRAPAAADLRAILDYSVDRHGIELATIYLEDIGRTLDRLREYPEIGEMRSDLYPGLRSLPCREHRIYYVYSNGHVSVARILHKAQDPRRWLP
jgi:toxin ParE1/3/4